MTKDIGKFLQEVRKSKGLTQKELAEQIGISDKTISKWENGNIVSRIIGGVVVFISLIFMLISNAGGLSPINNFIDFISLITVVMFEIGVILISGARTKEKYQKID